MTQTNLALTWRVLKRFWRTASGTGVTSCVYILQTQTGGTPGISHHGADGSWPTNKATAAARWASGGLEPQVRQPCPLTLASADALSLLEPPHSACSPFWPSRRPASPPANIWLRRLGSHLSPSNAAHRSLALRPWGRCKRGEYIVATRFQP